MRFRFTGRYTNGHTSVGVHGVTFHGFDAVSVMDAAVIARLIRHPEVEVVPEVSGVADIIPAAMHEPLAQAMLKKRGRPRKVTA
jgi:hypothetical protein